ncbi:MAG: radical SAM protein [Elusimicrobia bacterium]|nr:radical SAM protein [Elusimicrobiota bacterium]
MARASCLPGHPLVRPDQDRARRAASELLWKRLELPAGRATPAGPRLGTLYTGRPSPGCRNCLRGSSVSLRMTTRCTRECFFCFNPEPRRDGMSLDALPVRGISEAIRRIRLCGLRGAGISGGDPLLVLELTLRAIRRLRRAFGPGFYLHLYTNGDLATERTLRRLREAGLNGLRFNLEASGYRLDPVRRALELFSDVSVEIPVIPGRLRRLKALVLELDRAGVPNLILHELCYAGVNRARFSARGLRAKPCPAPVYISAKPVAGSEAAALELLRYAAARAKRLSVLLCSWTTQERLINPRGWRWRQRALQASASRPPRLRRPRGSPPR